MQVPQDSYVAVAEADAYHAMRPSRDAWALLTADEKEQQLVMASDFLDANYRFKGKKTDESQAREFPRNGQVDVPVVVKKAVFELAMQTDLSSNPEPYITGEKVAVIEVEYADSSAHNTRFAYIDGLLKDWLYKASGMGAIMVARGSYGCC